jgi:hypothetical protein
VPVSKARFVTVEKGGKFKDRARLGVRFTSVVALGQYARADSDRDDFPRWRLAGAGCHFEDWRGAPSSAPSYGAVIGGKKGAAKSGRIGRRGRGHRGRHERRDGKSRHDGRRIATHGAAHAPVTVTIDKEQTN